MPSSLFHSHPLASQMVQDSYLQKQEGLFHSGLGNLNRSYQKINKSEYLEYSSFFFFLLTIDTCRIMGQSPCIVSCVWISIDSPAAYCLLFLLCLCYFLKTVPASLSMANIINVSRILNSANQLILVSRFIFLRKKVDTCVCV